MEKLKKEINGKSQWASIIDYIDLIEKYLGSNSNLALDSSKSMLESVITTILVDKDINYNITDSLQVKAKKVFEGLEVMKGILAKDIPIGKSIIGSLVNISGKIGEFRNAHGYISHGRDLQSKNFDQYLLDLSVQSSELLTCFLIQAHDGTHEDRNRIYYDNFGKFNLYLNESVDEYPNFGKVVMEPSKFLFEDIEAYKEKYFEFDEEKAKIFNEFFQGWDEFEMIDLISFLPFFEEEELNTIGTYICENINTEFKELAENILEHLNESEEVIQFCLKESYKIID